MIQAWCYIGLILLIWVVSVRIPDKPASRQLSPEELRKAQERSQELGAIWTIICLIVGLAFVIFCFVGLFISPRDARGGHGVPARFDSD